MMINEEHEEREEQRYESAFPDDGSSQLGMPPEVDEDDETEGERERRDPNADQ